MGLDASKSLLQKVFTFFVFVQGQSNAMSDEIQMPAVLASSDTCHVDSSSSWKEQYDLLANVSPGGRAPPLLVQNSSIHGRGVYTPVLVEAGAKISFLWFDYEEHPGFEPESPNDSTTSSDSSSAAPGDDFLHKVGYIPAGGDLRVEDSIDVADAKRLCALNDACTAITFPNATGETIGSVQVNFKDKVDVSTTAASDWSSWLKPHSPKYKAVMYPWTCSGDIFPHLLPEDLPPVGMLTCATRLINHDCASSCDAIPERMPEDYEIPGLPYSRGKSVRRFQLIARRGLAAGEELTLNYFQLPSYMSKPPEFVNDRPGCFAAYGAPDPSTWADGAPSVTTKDAT